MNTHSKGEGVEYIFDISLSLPAAKLPFLRRYYNDVRYSLYLVSKSRHAVGKLDRITNSSLQYIKQKPTEAKIALSQFGARLYGRLDEATQFP